MTKRAAASRLAALRVSTFVNDPALAGKLAATAVPFGPWFRYAVAPVHTRFDAVSFFVWDGSGVDMVTGGPLVIRQAETVDAALAGLSMATRWEGAA